MFLEITMNVQYINMIRTKKESEDVPIMINSFEIIKCTAYVWIDSLKKNDGNVVMK